MLISKKISDFFELKAISQIIRLASVKIQLQTGNPNRLKLIACCPGAKPLEDKIHKYLLNKKTNAGSAKEWFELDEQDINDIEKISDFLEVKISCAYC